MDLLLHYDFPGNIRELRNLIERACILSTGEEITAENFPVVEQTIMAPRKKPTPTATPDELAEMLPDKFDLREFLEALEQSLIQRALKRAHGAQAEAARSLGLSRGDVFYKLSKHRNRNGA